MAATYISGLVIKHGNETFLDTDLVDYGLIMSIPTPGAGGQPFGDYWAVPINDEVVSGFNYTPTAPDSTDAPSDQAFHVFKLITNRGTQNDKWVVVGTTLDYISASADAECCSEAPDTLPTDVPALAPIQAICPPDADGDYFAYFGIPSLAFGDRLLAYGYWNGEALPALSGYGYTTSALLATAMTSAWGATVGGTFAVANGVIVLTFTDGDPDDSIAINIFASVLSS